MTISINGAEMMEIAQIAATAGSIVGTLIVCFIVYLMVRPSRRDREARREAPRAGPSEGEDMHRAMDRMTERLEVLERALADRIERPRHADDGDRHFAPADQGRDSGRIE